MDAADAFDATSWEEIGPVTLAVSERRRGDHDGAVRRCSQLGQSGSRQAIPYGNAGAASFVEGVMSIFVYTRKGMSGAGLDASNVVRRCINAWDQLPAPKAMIVPVICASQIAMVVALKWGASFLMTTTYG